MCSGVHTSTTSTVESAVLTSGVTGSLRYFCHFGAPAKLELQIASITLGCPPNTARWDNASPNPRDGHVASSDPVYLRVVADIRRQIVDGSLPPGAPIPSRAQLTRKYGVGETAARHALRVLAAEGLIVGRVGSGHYVREQPCCSPCTAGASTTTTPPSAPTSSRRAPGPPGTGAAEPADATPDIAQRLRLDESAP